MEVKGGDMRTEDMDEDDDDFAPDENLPQTTEAEDEALLAACNQETEGENTLSGKEAKLKKNFTGDKASKETVATI